MRRRDALRGACAFAALVGCGRARDSGGPFGDTARDTAVDSASADTGVACHEDAVVGEGWVEVPLAEFPALATPGGFAYVERPEALLDVVVVHVSAGCYAAIWRICTHGDCDTDWIAADETLVCPCHGSTFDTTGAILVGPATVPLRTFPAVRRGDSVWIHRPL